MLDGQMSLFDLEPTPDINDIPEAEAVRIVSERIGIAFTYNQTFEQWQGKRGKLKLDMNYGRFNLKDNHNLFLGVGYSFGTDGGSSPCSGIDEAVSYFKSKIERYLQ